MTATWRSWPSPSGPTPPPLLPARTLATAASPSGAGTTFPFLTSARSATSLGADTCSPNLSILEVFDNTLEGHTTALEHSQMEVKRFMLKTPNNFESAIKAAVGAAGELKITCLISDASSGSYRGDLSRDRGAMGGTLDRRALRFVGLSVY